MGELHAGPKHALSGAYPESYINHHMVPTGYQSKGEGDCGYLAQHNQAYSMRMELNTLGLLPT